MILFQDEHFACSGEFTSGKKRIEIDTTRHGLAEGVLAILICRLSAVLIYARGLMPERQCPNNIAIGGIYGYRHICCLCKLIRDPRLRVERLPPKTWKSQKTQLAPETLHSPETE